jgi:hypothetical protein
VSSHLATVFIFCLLKAEDIKEMNLSLSKKQRELTALETHRKHQKETLRRREEDLRGMFKNLILMNFGPTFSLEKR